MWKEYAESVGKAVNDLTTAEKRQAELTGIMRETRFQIGDAAKYSEQFAGAQAKAAAESTKLNQAFGASLTPALGAFLNVLTPVISGLTSFVKNNPELVATLTLTATAFMGIITVVTAVGAAVKLVVPALAALKLSLAGLMLNPVVLGLTALAAVAGVVATEVIKAKNAQKEYNAAIEKYNKIKKEGVTKAEVPQVQEEIKSLEKLIETYDKLMAEYERLRSTPSATDLPYFDLSNAAANTGLSIEKLTEEFRKFGIQIDFVNGNADEARKRLNELNEAVHMASRTTALEYADQAKSIAQKHVAVVETQNLIKAYKSAETGTKEWYAAQRDLAEQFPQFSSASGIQIEAIEDITTAQETAVKAEWEMMKVKIAMSKMDLMNIISVKVAALEASKAKREALNAELEMLGGKRIPNNIMMDDGLSKARSELQALRDELKVLDSYAGLDINKVLGIMPLAGDPYKAYENAALDSALKVLNHKKRMNQLSLEDELKTLESISKKYINTADERMDIDERIYDARQAIIERDKKSEEEAIEASNEALQKRTQSSLDWIESKKHIGDISAQDEIAAYDRMILYHQQYLDKLLAGKKELSEQEQEIREEEERQIKEFERKKYDIQKSYQEQLRRSAVDDINDLSSGVESALRKRYEKEKELREQALKDERESLDEWRDLELDRIKTVYDARINAITETAKAQKKSIQDEINSLDQSVKEKDRGEVDAAELQKISAIKERIQYEHDERNKLALQKELEKLQKDRENRLYKESVEDHKDSLRAKLTDMQENADRQKEILKQQRDDELARIQTLYDNEKLSIESRLESWRSYYTQRLTDANLQAEAEKLIIDNNQKEIITLLKGYGEDYKIVGQTLGEKLYEGFKPQVDAIRTLIANITAEINSVRDKALNAAVKASSPPATSGSGNQTASKSIVVEQNISFNNPSISPSEAARKQLQASRQLAQELG